MTDRRVRQFTGVAHGVVWKVFALLAKAGFLVVVAPRLPEGEFSAYVFLSTIGLLGARFFSCGISDQLVIEIRGSRSEAGRYVPLFRRLFAVGVGSAVLSAVAPGPWVAASLTMVLVAGSVLEGLLRSCTPEYYERLTNLTPILFFAACLAIQPATAHGLVGLFTGAMIIAQLVSGLGSGIGFRRIDAACEPGLSSMATLARHGLGKMVAELTLLANIRAVLLWPKLLSGALASDSVAFALSIAEAASTIPMVVVNRNYAQFANAPGRMPAPIRSATASALIMAACGVAALEFPLVGQWTGLTIFARIRAADLAWAMAYLGVVTAYYDLRYHAWSLGASSRTFTSAQVVFFGFQGTAVWLLPPAIQLGAITLAAALCVLAWVLSTRAPRVQ
jgi:hypothetical protein